MEFIADRNIRVDIFLCEKLGLSRRRAAFIIKNGLVKVNEKVPKKGDALKIGDRIFVSDFEIEDVVPDFEIKFSILFENDDFLAIEKPAGIPVEPVKPGEKGTIANFLRARYPQTSEFGLTKRACGILNRIDTMASGIILAAKNRKTFSYLRTLFQERKILKEFEVLVSGKVKEKGKIDLPIAHHPKNKKKMVVVSEGTSYRGKPYPALTIYRPEKYCSDHTHLSVVIKTGVTHQIRVHMSYINHPVLGDTLYDGPQAERLYIHLRRIKFRWMDEREIEIRSEVPWKNSL
jgi:23S rRNA pseudouridine1911/1915/1917 synthase